jgi:hypothetical protein
VIENPDELDQYAGLLSSSQLATLKKMLKEKKPAAEILAEAPEPAVGEAWRRKAMMRFARSLAKSENLAVAVAIATASQCTIVRNSDVFCGILLRWANG